MTIHHYLSYPSTKSTINPQGIITTLPQVEICIHFYLKVSIDCQCIKALYEYKRLATNNQVLTCSSKHLYLQALLPVIESGATG